ncbi:hypothetical protein [Nocardia sp. IFM 10818]
MLGKQIQQQYDQGRNWVALAVDFELSKTTTQRLAKLCREDCDRKAHQHQLTLFG